ncbi:MAG: manganese efflux pump MntP family protein [Candidatus Lokiarchaeota archaeon]|nr:manganese efflux pump MntP family protein [Candidatus Harpocratesius repetitus]
MFFGTFIFSFGGYSFGSKLGNRFQSKAEISGGIVLIILGIKIVVEHLAAI